MPVIAETQICSFLLFNILNNTGLEIVHRNQYVPAMRRKALPHALKGVAFCGKGDGRNGAVAARTAGRAGTAGKPGKRLRISDFKCIFVVRTMFLQRSLL